LTVKKTLMDRSLRPLKVILVGSSGVGKTSLINVFIEDVFDPNTQPTIAPAFCSKSARLPDGTEIDLHIWDTAGQERFQSIGSLFYRDADIALVCFDFGAIASIPEWVARVREQVADCVIILVATKSDLLSDDDTGPFMSAGNKYKDDVKARALFLTSASTNVGIQELYSFTAGCRPVVLGPIMPPLVNVTQQPVEQRDEGSSCSC
jgi:small GTP-binding protein